MALQQVPLSGVIICPYQELEQRFAVNSFTEHLSHNYKAMEPIKDRSADDDDGVEFALNSTLAFLPVFSDSLY
jgi:hypothetical protein